ncbi:alpha/beta hydrolase [Mesorhizobium sp. M1088]
MTLDLRGIGGSTTTEANFDAKTLATDVHRVAAQLGLKQPYIVGHDIGGQVAYAYALQYGRDTRGAIISETALLGMKGTDALDASPALWHVRFMQVPGVSEKLIAGRHEVFLGSFLDYGNFSQDERNLSLAAYERDDQMGAVLGIYRAFPNNAQFNSSHRTSTDIPIVFVTGDKSPFEQIRNATVEGMKAAGFSRAR